MRKTILLIIYLLPFLASSQEMQFLSGGGTLQNHLPKEFSDLGLEEDVFSLHVEQLIAEQGVKCLPQTMNILFNNTTLLPELSENFSRLAINSHTDLTTLLSLCFRLTGNTAGGFGPPLSGVPSAEFFIRSSDQLQNYLQQLESNLFFSFVNETDESNWEMLPFEFQTALIKFILACEKTESILNDFYSLFYPYLSYTEISDNEEIFNLLMTPWENRQLYNFEIIKLAEQFKLKELSFVTRILTENLRSLLSFSLPVENDFHAVKIQTKFGHVSITGVQKDTLKTDNFISIDFGGDDLYLNNCGSNIIKKNHTGLLIDYAGNDTYKNETGCMNAGILGLSFLFDLSGNDQYISLYPSFAFSLFGTSVLMDFQGDDKYSSSTKFAQGSSIAGVSVLCDFQGTDQYYSSSYSQGFGGTMGCGLLLDIKGNDLYQGVPENAEKTDPASFVQGASRGRWAEASDGQSLAGGFGVFVDGAGTDQYYAGSFSQGAGYYFSTGFFNDISGDDLYHAVSHSQGYAAHFAMGNFCDYLGNDKYNEQSDPLKITQIMGGGRDNSCGMFSDLAGDDSYYFGNRSAGIGDMRGTGCFYDPGGTNQFTWNNNSVNKNSGSLGAAIATPNAINGFRLFNNEKNWNSGIFIYGGENSFQKKIHNNVQSVELPEITDINSSSKTIQILKK